MTGAEARRAARVRGALWLGTPSVGRAMFLMLVASMASGGMSATIRYVGQTLHAFEVSFFRCTFGFIALLPFMLRTGVPSLRTKRFGMHALRGTLTAIEMLLNFLGLSLTPLAKAVAIGFSSPLFAALLAMLFLGEAVRARRIGALVVGFAGTLVVLRPGAVEIDVGSMALIGYAFFWGWAMAVIKSVARTESTMVATIYMYLFTTPLTFLAALPFWRTPTMVELSWLFVLGILGSVSALAFAQALKDADITAILPLDFMRLMWASILGFLVFSEIPEIWTWLGGAMIFGAATSVALGEGRRRRTPPPPPDGQRA